MTVTIRPAAPADAPAAGDIAYRAFKAIADAHGFVPDLPSVGMATGMVGGLIASPDTFAVVAEAAGRVVGSNFLSEADIVAGIGPITVDPEVQDDGIGRALMTAVMARAVERGVAGVRLVQSGYHSRSLAVYLKLGFDAREQFACVQGPPLNLTLPGLAVRAATADDLAACGALCRRVYGHARGGDVADAVARGTARVVERGGAVTGYTTGIAFFGHAVGQTDDDLRALIAAAEAFGGPGFLVPTRDGDLLRWCLGHGLRLTQTLTLMTTGLYNEPQGAWLPSILY